MTLNPKPRNRSAISATPRRDTGSMTMDTQNREGRSAPSKEPQKQHQKQKDKPKRIPERNTLKGQVGRHKQTAETSPNLSKLPVPKPLHCGGRGRGDPVPKLNITGPLSSVQSNPTPLTLTPYLAKTAHPYKLFKTSLTTHLAVTKQFS